MPIFEYRCNKCGNLFEELLLSNIERKVVCPECGEENTEKLPPLIGGISVTKSSSYPNCSSLCANGDRCSCRNCWSD